jgi:succinate dehydrogenase / fumarate reductase membrane anchor subunit
MTSPSFRSSLGKARGLGAAQHGAGHWWAQRFSGLALVPLSLWFLYRLVVLGQAPWETIVAWIVQPLSFMGLTLLTGALFYHAKLGIQIIFEDYIHHPVWCFTLLLANKVVMGLGALSSWMALLFILVKHSGQAGGL